MCKENRKKLISNILSNIALKNYSKSKINFFELFCSKLFFTLDLKKIESDKYYVSKIVSFIESVYNDVVNCSVNNDETEIVIDERENISILIDYSHASSLNMRIKKKHNFIMIMNKDMPFLVNSYTHCLKQNGYIIHYRLNLVLPIEKNSHTDNVKNKEKCFSNQYSDDVELEAYTIFVIHNTDKEKFEELRKSLLYISSLVRKVCASYDELVNEFPYLMDNIKNYKGDDDLKESVKDFYSWFTQNFSIFAIVERKFHNSINKIPNNTLKDTKDRKVEVVKSLGISDYIDGDIPYHSNIVSQYETPIYITRLEKTSNVHRDANIDCVRSKIFDKNGVVIGEHIIYGLFSSKLAYIDPQTIPIIGKKIKDVVKMASFVNNGFNEKMLINLLSTLPRMELFHIETEELFELAIVALNLFTTQYFRLFVLKDKVGMYIRVLLFVPNKNFNSDLQQFLLETVVLRFFGKALFSNFITNNPYFTMMQVIMKVDKFTDLNEQEKIEEELSQKVRDWQEELQVSFVEEYGSKIGMSLFKKYSDVFPINYRDKFKCFRALRDVKVLEKKYDEIVDYGIAVDLNAMTENIYSFNIFTIKDPIDISEVLPILENMYMDVDENETYKLNYKICDEKIVINHFVMKSYANRNINIEEIKQNFEDVFLKVKSGATENNLYNALVSLVNLNVREVMLIHSFTSYLKQINFQYSENYIQSTFIKYFDVVKKVLELFHLRFNVDLEDKDSISIEEIWNYVNSSYEKMGIAEDKIFHAMFNLVENIVRTNYYLNKDSISYKIDSKKINGMPLPKPLFEIFVFSVMFEAIHLRSGKVARGGIRWSDRRDDFRTEILGLVKAQTTKNVTIVPVGAKGGFVLRIDRESIAEDEYFEIGVNSYKSFLRALLDITDNLIDSKPVHPVGIRVYDDYDPYLVVAADKGTAKFSDYANDIANEYSYWLGDAFASGGSSGYDHKKIGITTKGAFESVKCHFWRLNKDIENESFTTVAIGDLAGDVFGNAMILTSNLKLIAAFNNMHIFVDPNPKLEESFAERKRIFQLETSTWEDYDKSIISEGGGIFSRKQKTIKISEQMKSIFEIKEDTLDSNDLIKKILTAKVDLIWNGGIGTFVKSSSESNEIVGDKANDSIRVNGEDLRARVFGEGGNLGFTQLGRIEYANIGGLLNTDSIDNTAGVCCSDHEVNIKILFFQLLKRGIISYEERNKVLAEMENDIRDTILSITNKPQALLLLREANDAKYSYGPYQKLLGKLEKVGLLNRKLEFLPSDAEIVKMKVEGKFFVRPHLAVIMAYTKMYLYEKILSSDICDDPFFLSYLFLYFPRYLSQNFADEIVLHPLKKEIISTMIVNFFINRMGCTFINSFVEDYAVDEIVIIKIIFIVANIYGITSFWIDKIEPLIGKMDVALYLRIEDVIRHFGTSTVQWFVRNSNNIFDFDVSNIISLFKSKIEYLMHNFTNILDCESLEIYNLAYNDFSSIFEGDDSVKILLASMATSMDSLLSIIKISNMVFEVSGNEVDAVFIGKIYFEIGNGLRLNWLVRLLLGYKNASLSQCNAMSMIAYDIIACHMKIVYEVIQSINSSYIIDNIDSTINDWIERKSPCIERFKVFLSEIDSENLELNKLIILHKRLEGILSHC